MYISKCILDEILDLIGSHPIESGGIMGCREDCICEFFFDNSFVSQYEYRPNVDCLNNVIQNWNSKGISFCGFAHSHLYGVNSPSKSDKIYAQNLFAFGTNINKLFFPIVTFDELNEPKIDFYQFLAEIDSFIKLSLGDKSDEKYVLLLENETVDNRLHSAFQE